MLHSTIFYLSRNRRMRVWEGGSISSRNSSTPHQPHPAESTWSGPGNAHPASTVFWPSCLQPGQIKHRVDMTRSAEPGPKFDITSRVLDLVRPRNKDTNKKPQYIAY